MSHCECVLFMKVSRRFSSSCCLLYLRFFHICAMTHLYYPPLYLFLWEMYVWWTSSCNYLHLAVLSSFLHMITPCPHYCVPHTTTALVIRDQHAIYSFIHSIGMCRMRRFLAVLRNFFHSSLLCSFSCQTFPPSILPSSLTSSCHLFLGLALNLVFPKFIYNTLLAILFFPFSVHVQTSVLYLTSITSILGFLTHA